MHEIIWHAAFLLVLFIILCGTLTNTWMWTMLLLTAGKNDSIHSFSVLCSCVINTRRHRWLKLRIILQLQSWSRFDNSSIVKCERLKTHLVNIKWRSTTNAPSSKREEKVENTKTNNIGGRRTLSQQHLTITWWGAELHSSASQRPVACRDPNPTAVHS